MNLEILHRPADAVVKHIANSAAGRKFDSRAGQIEHSVANGSPPLRRFIEAVLSRRYAAETNPTTSNTLQCNTASAKPRLPIRDTRQKFFAPCLFYFTVHRSRENLRNPSTFTYIIILVASSRAARLVSVNAP